MNYYKNMSKEDKKQLKENFKNEDNYLIYIKAYRIFGICVFGIIFGLGALVFDIIYHQPIVSGILDGLLLVFSIVFLIKMTNAKRLLLENYANVLESKRIEEETRKKAAKKAAPKKKSNPKKKTNTEKKTTKKSAK